MKDPNTGKRLTSHPKKKRRQQRAAERLDSWENETGFERVARIEANTVAYLEKKQKEWHERMSRFAA